MANSLRTWLVALGLVAATAALLPSCTCGGEPVVEQAVVLRLIPESVDFGDIPVGVRGERGLVVQNDGNAPWLPDLDAVVSGSGFALLAGCSVPVEPGATCTARLSFQPTAEGPTRGLFSLAQPDGVVVSAVLTGLGTAATLLLSPAVLDFGTVDVGASVIRSLTVENRGDAALDLAVVLEGGAFFVDGTARVLEFLEPNNSVDVDVAFAPSAGIAFAGRAIAEICGPGCGPAVTLQGVGRAPRIDVQPRRLELGSVERGSTTTGTLRIQNVGQGSLAIEGVDIEDNSGAFALSLPALPVVLGSGEGFDVVVAFSPLQGRGANELGVVVVRSTDPVSGSVVVPVAASSPGASLEVIPRIGQFGFLNEGDERSLSVVLRSTGDASVSLTSVRLEGDAGFTLQGAPAAGLLAAGDAAQFFVVARALAAAAGGAEATLVVTSDVGEARVPLAFASGHFGCVPRALIANANLGAVQVGLSKSADVVIENVGDAPCLLSRLVPAAELGLLDDADFDAVARGLDLLAPAALGLLSFGFSPERTGSRSSVVALEFEGRAAPLLVSASGVGVRGGLVGAPGSVVLGPVPSDCAAPTANVIFFNDGASPVQVDSMGIVDAGVTTAFSLSGAVAPFALLPGQSVAVVVVGDPGAASIGDNLGALQASSVEGLSARINLRLIVSEASVAVTEEFRVPDDVAIDVLLVVDNSGSMQDDQQLLADNFNEFIATALGDSDLDVQIGVTTTDVISVGGAAGRLVGRPAILSARDGLELARRVLVGIDGTGLELGLEAMRLALEVPENAGFVRSNAALAIVFVTDEEDAGAFPEFLPDPSLSRTPEEYVALLEARKAGSVLNAPVLVSAVLPAGGGNRYRAVVDHFGGVSLDITDPDWGTRLSEIGAETFALSRSFSLGSSPREGSIGVSVDGVPVSNFSVDAERRSVVLDEPVDGGANVVVTYVPQCQ